MSISQLPPEPGPWQTSDDQEFECHEWLDITDQLLMAVGIERRGNQYCLVVEEDGEIVAFLRFPVTVGERLLSMINSALNEDLDG